MTGNPQPGFVCDPSTDTCLREACAVSGKGLTSSWSTAHSIAFELPELGKVSGVGLVMWRRTVPHEVLVDGQNSVREAGFGLVFESLSLEARTAIARMVDSRPHSAR